MNVLIRSQNVGAVIVFGIFALGLGALSSAEPVKKTRISKIDSVKLSVSSVMKIKVSATGKVPTSGWTEPQLVPSPRTDKPENSDAVTMHFDFVATKPTGVVNQVETTIDAETMCPDPGVGKTLKVIVHSETNEESDSIKSTGDPR